MSNYTLTVLDTPGIQDYIFASNRLRENIGASELVWRALERWPLEVLAEQGPTNVADPGASDPDERLSDLRLESRGLLAEVLYVGGGNALVLFADHDAAREFVTNVHRRIREEAPGLNLAAAHVPVDWDQDPLAEKVDEAMDLLAQQKRSAPPTRGLLGQSVTAECRSTGLPATTTNAAHGKPAGEETYPISSSIAAKLQAVADAQGRLQALTSDGFRETGYGFPRNFDDFGRSEGEMSYIAVVHADGNGMGAFFRQVAAAAENPRAFVEGMRSASHRVSQASQSALRRLVDDLVGAVSFGPDGAPTVGGSVPVRGDLLPFRPLVFGGDDVTFVCDGRLGLSLAVQYLELFEEETAKHGLGDLHACAGVAVVKSHYPFSRAYQLSEALAGNAKTYVAENEPADFSALDWHFAATGLMGDIKEDIRPRQYTVALPDQRGKLTMRPVRLRNHANAWRTWPRFRDVVLTFQKDWEERRSKALALRRVLREGPEAVERWLTATGEDLPTLDETKSALQGRGWFGDRCGYFDAIEALDFYTPL